MAKYLRAEGRGEKKQAMGDLPAEVRENNLARE